MTIKTFGQFRPAPLFLTSCVSQSSCAEVLDWSDMEANRFGPEEFAPFAHEAITRGARVAPGHAYMWLYEHPDRVDFARIVDHIRKIPDIDLTAASEMNILVHLLGPDSVVAEVARTGLYSLPHPHSRRTLAESTLQALSHSKVDLGLPGPGRDAAWIAAVKVLLASTHKTYLPLFIRAGEQGPSRSAWPEFEPLLGELTRRSRMTGGSASTFERLYADLSSRYGDAPKAPRPRQPRTKKARQRGA